MDSQPRILARGPWAVGDVETRWHEEPYEPEPEKERAADAAIRALRERGSPSHDGVAARLAGYVERPGGGLVMDLQPTR